MSTDPRNGSIQVVASPDDMSFEFNPTTSTLRLFRPADPEPVKVVDVTLPLTPAAPRTVEDVAAVIASGTVHYFEDTRAGTLALKVGDDLYATCAIPREQ